MKQTEKLFLDLIKFKICKTPISQDQFAHLQSEDILRLYNFARKHDLAHVAAEALLALNVPMDSEISQSFKKQIKMMLLRHAGMEAVQKEIYQLFEREKIYFVPLKGAVIRDYYPDAWMRNSCDIDILVREEDLKQAKEALASKLKYRQLAHNYHDISFQTPNGYKVELHFKITENEKNIDSVLRYAWVNVRYLEEGRYQCEMTPEFLQFHFMAHMMYHFVHGGCGVRYVIDYWILKQNLKADQKELERLYRKSRLTVFAQYIDKLSRVWFEGESHDQVSKGMEKYIFEGGVFGTARSTIKARKTKTKGNGQYLMKRIFIPYKEFCSSYPKLEKYPVLYPYYTVKRWFKIFKKGTISQAADEVRISQQMEQSDVEELRKLFNALKL